MRESVCLLVEFMTIVILHGLIIHINKNAVWPLLCYVIYILVYVKYTRKISSVSWKLPVQYGAAGTVFFPL